VCGRLIRRAWMSGVEQTGAAPVLSSPARSLVQTQKRASRK
jgi:hypothetical protein